MASPPTDRFLAAIHKSHEVYAYVQLVSPDGDITTLPVSGGDVRADRTAAVRRSITIDVIDRAGDMVPRGVNSPLTPYGAELRPFRGVRYPDGTTEVYPLGVFRVAKVSVKDTTGGAPTISVEGFDRSRTVSRDKFTTVYTVASGTNIVQAVKDILARTFDQLEYNAITTSIATTAPQVYDAGNDPWDACTVLARSIGCEVYFDAEGVVVIAPPVDIDSLPNPDFTYIEGQSNTLTDLSRVYSDEPGFNGVIVTGESVGDEKPPVRGEAWDDEPTSVTYRRGPYGEVPLFIQDTNVKTNEDATVAAKSLLSNQLGFSSQLDATGATNPTYEAGQVVQVVRARSFVDDFYIVDAFNVPLRSSATQSLRLRQKRATS